MNIKTISEAAELLGIARQGVLKHIQRGHLPAFRAGKLHLINLSDLQAFKAESEWLRRENRRRKRK